MSKFGVARDACSVGPGKSGKVARIVVVGANGAGKTWLATRIAEVAGMPVVHNDALALTTGWRHRPRHEVAAMRAQATAGPSWVLEGGPSTLSAAVLSRATLIIWCDPPALVRAWRILRRSIYYMGRTRPEHPCGNPDWPGLRQMRFLLRALTSAARIEAAVDEALQGYEGRVIRVQSRADASALIKAAREGAEGF